MPGAVASLRDRSNVETVIVAGKVRKWQGRLRRTCSGRGDANRGVELLRKQVVRVKTEPPGVTDVRPDPKAEWPAYRAVKLPL